MIANLLSTYTKSKQRLFNGLYRIAVCNICCASMCVLYRVKISIGKFQNDLNEKDDVFVVDEIPSEYMNQLVLVGEKTVCNFTT
jgi:hypothetical protein